MSRLDLDDPCWQDLKHAYGSAEDIPGLLKALRNPVESWSGEGDPMFTLWSSLWHQGDVYSASYAAVPHLLDAVPSASPEGQRNLITLVTSILSTSVEAASPEVGLKTLEQFDVERLRLQQLAIQALDGTDDTEGVMALLAAIAIAKKSYRVGNLLLQVDESWECLECGAPLPGETANG